MDSGNQVEGPFGSISRSRKRKSSSSSSSSCSSASSNTSSQCQVPSNRSQKRRRRIKLKCKRDFTMAPLVLEGETLGQKQHSLNKLVEAAVADESSALPPLDYDAADVDNLVRIDVACRRRDVGYVLAALQSEDMLYVSRAIKRATWLITDDQYAHIINPKHLHDELFPKMTSKAKNKLLSAIKINLKNEARVDEFFYYFENDLKVAQKWLPHCSLPLIEKVYRDKARQINLNTFKRLCERSISILKILTEQKCLYFYIRNELTVSKILLNKDAEEYLKIMEPLEHHNMPTFGVRATRQLMKYVPDKVINEFDKFSKCIHLPTFATYLKKEKKDIQGFLLKQAENKKMKDWINKYDNVKHFAKYLPIASRFEFIKKLFIDKKDTVEPKSEIQLERAKVMMMPCVLRSGFNAPDNSNANIYRWYRFASFDTAFADLKKLIRVESSPAERTAMLIILINCARRNLQQVQTLLQHYREKHMNEPFKFKVQFVNSLLSSVATHKFDQNTWAILNDIFSSMEVYIESENSVPHCIKAIIVYKLLQNEDIPEIIIKKHTFDTFKDYPKKLDEKDREVLFKYLYKLEMNKLQKQTDIKSESEMSLAVEKLNNILSLLKEWKMKLSDYPEVLDQVRRIIRSKKEHSIKWSLTSMMGTVQKKWTKEFFEESLALQEDDVACVHALKHDPGLLLRHSTEVAAMCSNDTISLKNTLSKLRIYWTQSLAEKWADQYLEELEKPTGHKAAVEGICILLPRKKFLSLLEKYTPEKTKIDWSNTDTATLSVQKNIAKRMMMIRPSLKLDAILSFAKGDYLQFAMPSLNAVLYNMSATQVSEYIPILMDSPVSLKKHGVRLAYTKLKFSEIKDLIGNTWKNTKNSTIKTVLFKETFELLKKEKKESAIQELWELMSMFIENLTPDENRIIYNTLGNADDVPLLVRPKFLMKAYLYLKSLPAKANCENILRKLDRSAIEIIKQLEPSFVEQVLLKPVDELVNIIITEKNNDRSDYVAIMTAYIINSSDLESQYATYEKYLTPILNGCFQSWKKNEKHEFTVRSNCINLLRTLLQSAKSSVSKTSLNVNIFKDIEKRYRMTLPLEENYRCITYWTIATLFMDLVCSHVKQPVELVVEAGGLEKKDDPNNKWKDLCTEIAPLFGKSCLNFIKQDISTKLHSLVAHFAGALSEVLDLMDFTDIQRLQTLKNMLDGEVIVSYLIVIEAVSSMYCYDKDEEKFKLKLEIYNKIKIHPSPEVKIHYHEALFSDPQQFEVA